ncbi:MAG: TIGR00269 family protein [Methanospirillum sp.]|nr:TIGR00269 family protein [Methanospirillum sp.]
MADKPGILCDLCRSPAVFLDRASKAHLCRDHLMEHVEKETLGDIQRIPDLPKTIGIAFSGGKDSTALLKVFSRIKEDIPCRFIALTIDEGIEGYRQETILAAEETCKNLGVEHHIIRFSDLFGSSLDQLVKGSGRNACTICGILRRRALEILAREQGIRVIATGHNLDDHAQTALMNAISGDVKKVFAGYGPSAWYARRIKPFARISEREVTLYAMLSGLFRDLPECPYALSSLRGEVRTLLSRYEREHPGAMRNAATCEEEIRKKLGETFERAPYQACTSCGWPGSGDVCQVCTVLKGV